MKKRLAILIAAAMMFTSMPFYVFADDNNAAGDPAQADVSATEDAGNESADPAEPENPAEPTEPSDPAEPTEPSDPAEPAEPQPVAGPGWNEDHTAYYDENGVAYADIVAEIDGALCYFNADGLYDNTNGWKTTPDGKYYINKSGKIVTGPTKVKGSKRVKKYYNKKTKSWQKTRISGARTKWVTVSTNYLYMFRKDGRLKTTKGLYKLNGKEYYGLGKGRLKTGWKAIVEKKKGKAVYFNKNTGAMVKNKKVGYLKVPKSGRLGKAYYLGVKRLDKIGWSLRKAYSWSAHMRYQGRSYRAKNSETYAIKGFTKGYGNCYCMAATFYIMAKLLGYDIHQVEGRVDLPHSWTVIRQDGREWVYDPNFTNETGRNGWKIYYGKKGTWRYNHYHKMN